MREYTSKVDRLEEAENARISEKKETEYKPVVLGNIFIFSSVKINSFKTKMSWFFLAI